MQILYILVITYDSVWINHRIYLYFKVITGIFVRYISSNIKQDDTTENKKAYEDSTYIYVHRYKEIIRFEEDSVDYITNWFLPEAEVIDWRRGALTYRQ